MEEPFSFSGHKLDSSIFPFSFSFPTFHQVDNILLGSQITPNIITTPGRKRGTAGKDRHSKICTALGMRNRRMRLSLDVAPDFFNIQDMLGFDNASKTLRWLITMAKPAIRDLVASNSANYSGSKLGKEITSPCQPAESLRSSLLCRRLPSRRAALPAAVARELRVKARERARQRTEKKRLLQSSTTVVPPFDEAAIAKVVEEEYCCRSSPNQRQLAGAVFDYYNQRTVSPNDVVNLFHQHWVDMEDVQLLQSRLWEH